MNTEQPRRVSSALGWLVLGVVMALGFTALADGDPTTDTVPRVLPYQGTLEQNGQPIHAVGDNALAMRFSLYDGLEGEEAVYIQDLSVEVFAGRFTANIGPLGTNANGDTTSIIEVIQAADDLHLGMTLLGDVDDPEDDIALSNRQRIHASPYSMWTTSATSLDVAVDLEVGNNIVVGNDANVVNDLDVGNSLSVGNAINLPDGAIEVADIDSDGLDGRIRSWVRAHCTVRLGWRDGCDGCGSGPSKNVTVQANDTCVGGSGTATSCRGAWGGVNTDGDVDGNDVFYIRFNCD